MQRIRLLTILVLLVIALCFMWYGNRDRKVDMNEVYALLFMDCHETPPMGPGKYYTYVIKDNQIYAIVQEIPNYWNGVTEMYYCPKMSDALNELILECNKVWPDIKPPILGDGVPYLIRYISSSSTAPSKLVPFTGFNDTIFSCFWALRLEIIVNEYETSEIPDYVLDNAEIAKMLFIPEEYFKDKL